MDTSRGITSELLSRMKNFVLQQNDIYKVSDVGARFSLISYADRGVMQLPLNRGTSIAAVRNALNSIGLTGRQRRVESGLQVVRDVIVNKRDGVQEDRGKVIVLMVGGKSDQFGLPSIKSEADELKRAGAKVVVMGIGLDLDETALKSAASKPETFVAIKSEGHLLVATPSISDAIKHAGRLPMIVDLGFVLGADGPNAEKDFALGKEVIKAVLKRLLVSKDMARVGLIVYGKRADIVLRLDQISNTDTALKLVDRMRTPEKGFALSNAITMARNNLFNSAAGARQEVPKTMMIFVNRDIDRSSKLAAEALKQDGVKIVALWIGSKDATDSLESITTNDQDILRIDDAYSIKRVAVRPASFLLPGKLLWFLCFS